jgi:hypothetical protein
MRKCIDQKCANVKIVKSICRGIKRSDIDGITTLVLAAKKAERILSDPKCKRKCDSTQLLRALVRGFEKIDWLVIKKLEKKANSFLEIRR